MAPAPTQTRDVSDAGASRAMLLRERRRDLGLNLEEAAAGCGVSRGTLQRLEAGKGFPHPSTAKAITDFYGDLKPSDVWPVAPREEVPSNA
jgi:transcriptional regulator with XRE-family HTH domain